MFNPRRTIFGVQVDTIKLWYLSPGVQCSPQAWIRTRILNQIYCSVMLFNSIDVFNKQHHLTWYTTITITTIPTWYTTSTSAT
jgi:hypothetical protein